jgi:D-threonate/D-erythronate kinase
MRRAIQAGVVRHVMIEGGATAASILNVLGWQRLAVVREWVPGVATLRPAADEHLTITMKPGSYVWPSELWSHVNAN